MKNNLLFSFVSIKQKGFFNVSLIGLIIWLTVVFCSGTVYSQQTVIDNSGEANFFYKNDFPHQKATSWTMDIVYKNTYHCREYPRQICNCPGNLLECYDPNGCNDVTQTSRSCVRDVDVVGTGTQGIAHDNNNWFISTQYYLWKIPVGISLDRDDLLNVPGVKRIDIKHKDALSGYKHCGDLDYYKGYLVVPLTGSNMRPAIAIFRASDLEFIDFATLNGNIIHGYPPYPSEQKKDNAGWCAITHDGFGDLVTSNDDAIWLYRYKIDWDLLSNTGRLIITIKNTHLLRQQNGSPYYTLFNMQGAVFNMQGGEFSPNGEFLYVTCGILECYIGPFGGGQKYPTDGLHVFRTSDWREISRAINGDKNEAGCFDYSFDNGCALEEPEGLTIWDLDDGRAPGITGQLHVIVFNHNILADDQVSLKHYKSFKRPADITVFGTTANGEPATNPIVKNFLTQGTPILNTPLQYYNGCAYLFHNAPAVFPPGKTPVKFTITDNSTVNVECTANVNVINVHDECSTAFLLQPCTRVIMDNICATPSASIPGFSCYSGPVKDVWVKIIPTSSSLSVETSQVAGGLTDLVMQAFSGTCGNLHEIACDDNSGDGDHAKITLTNLPNLNPIYIRILDKGGNDYGEFSVYYQKNLDTGSNIFVHKGFISGFDPIDGNQPSLKGDVNGDGKTDFVLTYYDYVNGLTVRTKISNGDGTYTAYQQILGDIKNHHDDLPIMTGDVNEDGKTDLILLYWDNINGLRVRCKISNGNGTYTATEQVLVYASNITSHPVLTGDINGDGKTDLIFVGQDWFGSGSNIITLISNGNGTFTSHQQVVGYGNGIYAHPALTGDVNGDGKTDIILMGQDWFGPGSNMITEISDGNGNFTSHQQVIGFGNGIYAHPALTGDVNGDGKTDIIFVGQNWFGVGLNIISQISNGNGTYTVYHDVLGDGTGVYDYPTLTGDVNGDGKTDLIFTGQNWGACGLNIRVKFSQGIGKWCTDGQIMGDGSGVHQYPTLTGDINGDGKTDLIYMFKDQANGLIIRSKISQSSYVCTGKISNPTLLSQSDPFIIYPNPTNGRITIKTDAPGEFEITINELSGRLILPTQRFIGSIDIDLSSLVNGIYIADIYNINSKEKYGKKIIKME